MNLTVESPSKVIKMRMSGQRAWETPRCASEPAPGSAERPKGLRDERKREEKEGRGKRIISEPVEWERGLCTAAPGTKDVSIDFFDLNSGERPHKEDHLESDVGNAMARPSNHEGSDAVLEKSFIETALRNDIRVKDIKHGGDLIFIYFFTLEDSISFYRQFLPYVELHFSDSSDLEQVLLLTPSEWASISLSSTGHGASPPSLGERTWLEMDSGEDSMSVHGVESSSGSDATASPWSDATNSHKGLSPEVVFEKKIEYFTHLRNFFSKSEVKAMAQSLEAGRIDFVFKNTKELAVGSQSNKIMQEALGLLSEAEIARVIQALGHDIAPIAANKHGAYTIQMLISVSKTTCTQSLLSKYFRDLGGFLITHEIGNYTIQKILRFDPDLIFEFFMLQIDDVAKSTLGMKVLRRCLEFFPDKRPLLVQRALEHGRNLGMLL